MFFRNMRKAGIGADVTTILVKVDVIEDKLFELDARLKEKGF